MSVSPASLVLWGVWLVFLLCVKNFFVHHWPYILEVHRVYLTGRISSHVSPIKHRCCWLSVILRKHIGLFLFFKEHICLSERSKDRESWSSHPLVHSPDVDNIQGWMADETRSRKLNSDLPHLCQRPHPLNLTVAWQAPCWMQAGVRTRG